MKAKLTIAISALIILVACSKDKFQDEPHITIKSISPSTVSNGNIIEMNGKFTDANGDLDSALVVYKWYNGTLVTKADTFRHTFKELNLPSKTKDGDINVTFAYNVINTGYVAITGVQRDTTATFGLILVDKAANRSNYSESDRIRLKKV